MPMTPPVLTGKVDPDVERAIMNLIERSNQQEALISQLKAATKQK